VKSRGKFLKDSLTVILLTVGATALRYLFDPTLGPRSPLLFHILAVAIAAQIAGLVSGLVVTGFSVILIDYFFMPPLHTLGPPPDPSDKLALLLFVGVGVSLSIFGGQQKRAEERMSRIRYNLETAQQIANVGSWESDGAGEFWWSEQAYRIFGVSPGTKLNTAEFYDLVHPEDRDAVRHAAAMAIETETDYDIEHRLVRKSDGDVRYVQQQAKVITGDTRLIGSIRDLTDTRRGELAQQILGGLLQICSACRRIRDKESDQWYSMEGYLRRHSNAKFSHGMCEDCGKQWSSEKEVR